ncbi:MAG TPA: HlyD family efflux transporter periplasmic adaptor subunit [Azospirillaceae bacterium]|nr:HlyD family efflux transporter periplasmic adaptor subunit [Azospirillaceae bacterium]
MTRRPILLAALVLALAAAAAWGLMRGRPQAAPDRLVLYGNVDIRQVNLGFNAEGRIKSMAVDEGNRVEAGQSVAALEPDYYDDLKRLADARVAAQRAQLAKMEAGNRAEEIALARAQATEAEAALTLAKATLQRQEALARRDVASRQELDAARAGVDEAQARLQARREQLALALAGPRKEDIEATRAQLDADLAAQSVAERRLADTTLTAPSAGTVLTRVLEPGAIVLPGSTVYTIALDTPVWVRAYVGEPDLGRVRPGMAAKVTTDGGKVYDGRIGFISPVAEFTPRTVETPDLRTSLVYRLRVVIERVDGALRQGMPVTVTLDTPES